MMNCKAFYLKWLWQKTLFFFVLSSFSIHNQFVSMHWVENGLLEHTKSLFTYPTYKHEWVILWSVLLWKLLHVIHTNMDYVQNMVCLDFAPSFHMQIYYFFFDCVCIYCEKNKSWGGFQGGDSFSFNILVLTRGQSLWPTLTTIVLSMLWNHNNSGLFRTLLPLIFASVLKRSFTKRKL